MAERRMLLNSTEESFIGTMRIEYYSEIENLKLNLNNNIKIIDHSSSIDESSDYEGYYIIGLKNELIIPENFINHGAYSVTRFFAESDNIMFDNNSVLSTETYFHGNFTFAYNSILSYYIHLYGDNNYTDLCFNTPYGGTAEIYFNMINIKPFYKNINNDTIYSYPHILYDLMKYNDIEECDEKAKNYITIGNHKLIISSPTEYITTIPNVNLGFTYINSVNNYMYNGNYITTYICNYPISHLRTGITLPQNATVYFPDSVTYIDSDTFESESNLEKVVIFSNCGLNYLGGFIYSGIKSIISFKKFNNIEVWGLRETKIEKIPNGDYNSIGDRALLFCYNLTGSVYLKGMLYIGEDAFYETNINKVVYYGTLEEWCLSDFYSNPTEISKNLYINDEKLVNLTIPDNITTLKRYTFHGIILDNVDLNKVEIIDGNNALDITCNYINIPNTLKEINDPYGFRVTAKELNICDLNNYLNITGDIRLSLFWGLEKLYIDNIYTEDLIIPENITVLKRFLLSRIPVKTVNAVNVIDIEQECFSYTATLNIIKLSNKLKNIGYQAFQYVGDLTIEYDGTEEEWNNVIKDDYWNRHTNITYIFKTDVV